MVTLDLDHPDIEEYIDWKLSEEEKVSALVIGSNLYKVMPMPSWMQYGASKAKVTSLT